jgi:hypothetical protein
MIAAESIYTDRAIRLATMRERHSLAALREEPHVQPRVM